VLECHACTMAAGRSWFGCIIKWRGLEATFQNRDEKINLCLKPGGIDNNGLSVTVFRNSRVYNYSHIFMFTRGFISYSAGSQHTV